jgi:hypothetical protein
LRDKSGSLKCDGRPIAGQSSWAVNGYRRASSGLMNLESEMYGLSRDVSLDPLNGKCLLQVCIGEFQSVLNFDGNVSISIEGEFNCDFPDQSGSCTSKADLLQLIGTRILLVNNTGNGDLMLTFSSGAKLSLHDSNPAAESYEIAFPGCRIIV